MFQLIAVKWQFVSRKSEHDLRLLHDVAYSGKKTSLKLREGSQPFTWTGASFFGHLKRIDFYVKCFSWEPNVEAGVPWQRLVRCRAPWQGPWRQTLKTKQPKRLWGRILFFSCLLDFTDPVSSKSNDMLFSKWSQTYFKGIYIYMFALKPN